MRHRRFAVVFLLAALAVVAGLTLTPSSPGSSSPWWCLVCGGMSDAILNVLLFVPVGVGLALVGVPWRRAILVGVALTFAIESAQFFLPGRDASIGDMLTNTLGAALGLALVSTSRSWLRPPTRLASRLSAGAAAFAALVFLSTSFLLAPSYPDSVYYGQWTPVQGHLEPYRGRVLSATIGPYEVHSWRLDNSNEVRAALEAGDPVDIVAVAGPTIHRLGAIFKVADSAPREILLVGVDRDELVLRFRTRASDFRFDQPELRLTSPVATATPGDTLHITTWQRSDGRCVETGGGSRCGLGYTLGNGWTLLMYPSHLPTQLRHLLNAAWIALLVFPAGFWFRTRPEAFAGVALIAVAPAMPLIQGGLLPTPVMEWVGAVVGFVVGVGCWVLGVGVQVRHHSPGLRQPVP